MMTSEERKIMIELGEIGDRLKEIYHELDKDDPESATLQRGNSGPGRIDAHEPTFYDEADALSFADAFSSMEDP